MKRILFMIPNLGHGGAEKVLVNLVNHMDKSKFDITVMTLYDEGVNKKYLSSEVKYMSCFKRSFPGVGHLLKLLSPKRLYTWLVKDEYDIVVSYLEGQTARIVSGCNDKHTKKVCWIHRTMTTIEDASRLFRNKKETVDCYNQFDCVVSVSKDVENAFMNLFPLGDKGVILHNTNRTEWIKKCSFEPVNNQIFVNDEVKLCAMGSLIPVKGFDRLMTAHARLLQDGYSVHTYLLGEGSEMARLQKKAEDLNILRSITFLGYQENPYNYLKQCDLFVCSSYSEGLSTAVIEALILGIPIVTTDVSGMREILGENNEYGLVVDNDEEALYQGIKRLITDKELLSHYKQKAIERGKRFSTEETVRAVEEMLVSL